jgi:hypothetical protein
MSQKKVQLLNPLSGNINVAGVITASSFVGSGEGLTGVASTDNIQTATPAKFLSDVSITGVTTVGVVTGGTSISAGVYYGDGSALTGIDATKLTDSGGSTIVQANPNGAVVTGVLTATTGSFSGNVTIGGTLTYQDVENIDSVGIITAQQGIQVLANGLTVTGVSTFNDNISLQDDDKILVGTGNDLEIFHDGSNSFIKDVGDGILQINTNYFQVKNAADDEFIIQASQNGAVSLRYDNSEKLATSATGVTVTGTLAATALSGDGSAITGLSVGISTAERTGLGNTTIFLDLTNAQHHTITLAAGISTIDCTGGSVGDSHSVVLINPSSVGTGVTVGFATDFLFPSGSTPSLPTGANDISLISFVVKQTGAGGTEVLASAGLNYSN